MKCDLSMGFRGVRSEVDGLNSNVWLGPNRWGETGRFRRLTVENTRTQNQKLDGERFIRLK